ncbi:MAG: Pr6Pr family membrane protein [Candidatus Izemoplasmatales bacterium]
MDKSNLTKKILRIIIFSLATIGFIWNTLRFDSPLKQLTYFTIQSNILVAFVYLVLLLKKEETKLLIILKRQATVAIILTGLVYNFILKPYLGDFDYTPNTLPDLLVHSITPLLVFVDYLVFSHRFKVKIFEPLYSLIFPLIYWLFTIIYRLVGGNYNGTNYESDYPYFFLNFPEYGVGYFLIVLVFIITIIYFLYIIDLFINKRYKGVK